MEVLKGKGKGFFVMLAAIVMALVTAIAYAIIYSPTRYMSWEAFAFLLVGAALAIILFVIKKPAFAPTVLFVTGVIGTMFYAYHIYFFISSVAVGIQFSGFPFSFYLNIVFYVLTIALSIAAIFLPQTKEEK